MTTESIANILLVDDDLKTLTAMEALLEGPRRNVVKARSGPDALRCLLRRDFALILLDVRMPEMDGFETATLIRERERSRYTPIIFLSAVDTLESDVLKGVASGAVDYLFKPVVPQVLKAKVGVFVDLYHMNERLKQQALRQSEERYRLLVESLQDYSVVMLNPEGLVTSWNRGAERIKGYRQEEIIGRPYSRFYTSEDQEKGRPDSILKNASAQGHYEEEGWRARKDGSLYWANVVITAVTNDEGELVGFSEITRDLTERKRAEEKLQSLNEELERRVSERTQELMRTVEQREKLQEQLLHAQKMESIGTLAGGIAHDFNNILNIILGYASVVSQEPGNQARVEEGLTIIGDTVKRGTSLVQQLLTLARKSDISFEPADINGFLQEFAKLLSETFPKTMTITLRLDPQIPPIMADPNRLNQVMLNLCVNARDAMEGTGRLSLSTEIVPGDALRERFPEAALESYVCLAVSDTGAGMDSATRERIFDPFFTTKRHGQGTGLGLTVVYGVVRRHDGFIEVDSEVNRGSTFRIYVPLRPANGATATLPIIVGRGEKKERGDQATILLVDDEEDQLLLVQRFLQKKGFQVLVARDGAEALEVYNRHGKEIDAMILDLGLPKVSGWETFLRIQKSNPEVKTIFTSGYINPELKSQMVKTGVREVVQKPYLPDQLLAIIRELLNEADLACQADNSAPETSSTPTSHNS